MNEDKKLKIKVVKSDDNFGKFVCEPLDKGYGHTLGNCLRRILLSSIDGAAVTAIKIDGILHEFSTIPGVREDVTEIILNLKKICLKIHNDEIDAQELSIDVSKEGVITAGSFDVNSDIEILNPDLHIATLDKDAHLVMTIFVERGKGYVPAIKNKNNANIVGVIPIDAIFSPILSVQYDVSDSRVGNELDYDKLTLEIKTDGSVAASDATAKAATIMISYLNHFQKLANSEKVIDGVVAPFAGMEEEVEETVKELVSTRIDELELSVRAVNCLKRANINSLSDFEDVTKEELTKIRNLGKKSVDEIINKVASLGIELKEKNEE